MKDFTKATVIFVVSSILHPIEFIKGNTCMVNTFCNVDITIWRQYISMLQQGATVQEAICWIKGIYGQDVADRLEKQALEISKARTKTYKTMDYLAKLVKLDPETFNKEGVK